MWRDVSLLLVLHKSGRTGDDGQARDVRALGGVVGAKGRVRNCARASRRGTAQADDTDLLLSVEPDNMQAQSLRQQIDRAVQRDGYIGAYHSP